MRGVRLELIPIQHLGDQLARAEQAARQAAERAGRELLADFEKTTATWQHRVAFDVRVTATSVTVETGNAIWRMVDAGTRRHVILPRRARRLRFLSDYTPKTRVGSIIARRGGAGGDAVFARIVHHPGTKARKFSARIRATWKRRWPALVQQAVQQAVRG